MWVESVRTVVVYQDALTDREPSSFTIENLGAGGLV